MKKNYKKIVRMNNAIDPATSTARSFGFHPVPKKGGKTTNCDPEMKVAEAMKLCKEGK